MSYFQAVFLGLIQGIAEFLPISSSGHLKLFERLLGLPNVETDYILFDVMLHLGTLIAVLLVYWSTIKSLAMEFFGMVHLRKYRAGERPNYPMRRMILLFIVSLLPLFLVLPVKDWVEKKGSSMLVVGLMLITTGIVLYVCDHLPHGKKTEKEMTLTDAVVIGFAQLLAVMPGLSRSGMTISAGSARGLSREYAVRFSFIMSIPTIVAAILLNLAEALQAGIEVSMIPKYVIAIVVSMLSGIASLRFLQYISRKNQFGNFAFYCWGAGLVSMFMFLIS